MKHLDAAFVDVVFEIGSWIIKFGKHLAEIYSCYMTIYSAV